MGRYLQAFKEEGRALVGRRREPDPPTQPYYDERRPPQPYDEPTGQMTRGDFQAALEQARRQERQEMMDRLERSSNAQADRLANLAMAAINRPNVPVEIRYRGSASDKKERRFAELKFAAACILLVLALMAIYAVKDSWNASPGWGSTAAAPMNSPHRPAHYKRSEEWDDR